MIYPRSNDTQGAKQSQRYYRRMIDKNKGGAETGANAKPGVA
ncbi:hypothetical protein LEP1GSC047_0650 [Leptospira inadai serovar Lyme str. 10]|uniref:Uncharacterized protein n=1 Tax=Leptospira inadai serovar Lyme str. 10 TaxID=1049790 RepID=V6HBT5_9LEPT|nr:hypothetical protein LEP1GSC047_0650 [Leptospira inadai serovar Lyme str. 10]